MAHLSLSLLGPFQASLGDEPLFGFRTNKVKALLIYLAAEYQAAQRREAMMTLLWSDFPEDSARYSLRQALYHLRQAIPELPPRGEADGQTVPFLLSDRQTVQLNLAADFAVDVQLFSTLISQTKAHAHQDLLSCKQCRDDLDQASELYRGDFLADFYLSDSNSFEEWAALKRETLRRDMQMALDSLSAIALKQRNYREAQAHARRQLEIDELNEQAHRQLMQALVYDGQRNEAMVQYEKCRSVLEKELGVAPEKQTTDLYERIAASREVALVDDLAPIHSSPYPVISAQKELWDQHNLPSQPMPFIGREAELAALHDLLTNPDVRLLTILGAGGIGKTRLALAAAEAQLAQFANAVVFVSLAPVQDVEAIVPTIAQAVNFSFIAGGTPHEQLLNFLRSKKMLLVMDNYEHLLDDLGIITDILQYAPGVKVLATSREKLGLQGEWLFRTQGMDFPETLPHAAPLTSAGEVEDAQRCGAVKLFFQNVQRVRAGYEPAPDDWPYIVRICQLAQGMPLGILLASAWIELLTPREIAHEIDRSMDFLQSDLKDMPDRHQSMRAVFDSSWNLISDQEQKIFAALSVFRGGFSRLAAQKVTGFSLQGLLGLVDKSLIQSDGGGRFSVHELLRQYAAGRLIQSPSEFEAVKDQHSAFYCAELQRLEAEWKSGKEVAAFSAIETDFENVRSAWSWAAERKQFRWLGQAMDSLGEFFSWQARYLEGEALFEQATSNLHILITGAEEIADEALRVQARALVWQAEFNREFLGNRERAAQLLEKCQGLLQELESAGQDIRREKAFLLKEMARMARDAGEQKRDRQLWLQSLELSQELGDREWIAYKTAGLAWMAFREGDFDQAQQHFQEALLMAQELGTTMYVTNLLGGLGSLARINGRLEESEKQLRKVLATSRERGQAEKFTDPYLQLGWALLFNGKFQEALAVFEEGIQISNESGRIMVLTAFYEGQTGTLTHLGQYEQAQIFGQKLRQLGKKLNHPVNEPIAIHVHGMAQLAEGDYEGARQSFQECINLFQEFGRRGDAGRSSAFLGIAQQELGQHAQARQSITTSINLALEMRSFSDLLYVLPTAALLLDQEGQRPRALEIYTLVSGYPFVVNSHWFAGVIGKKIAANATSLLPEMVTINQEREKARQLQDTAAELSAEWERNK